MPASKPLRKKKRKKELAITCEILPPGSLKSSRSKPGASCHERWDEIVEICAEVIAEDGQD